MVLRVGIAGSGIGGRHLAAFRALSGLYDVRALCDTDVKRAQALAAEHGVPDVVSEFSRLCARTDIDVIDICTPSALHVEQVREALAAGKHVICEKPVAGSLRAVDRLIAAEAGSGRRVMPIFQSRFGAGIQKLKLLVACGVAGRAYLATSETSWRRRTDYYAHWHGRWDAELGGPLVTLAIHPLDLVLYILGPAAGAFAFATTRVNPIETEDCLSASIRMADGSLFSLSLTTGSSDEVSRLRFCFEGLSAEAPPAPYAFAQEPWRFCADSPANAGRMEEALRTFRPQPEAFEGQFTELHAAIQSETPLPVTLQDARAALELITAIYQSVATGTAVDLPVSPASPAYDDWRPRPR